jgi:O-Antigen ligase
VRADAISHAVATRSPAGLPGAITAREGERLAVTATAAAVATLPLLTPRSPANMAPVDALIAVAIGACLLWAGTSHHPWRWPYAVPGALLMAGGALGALAGPVPGAGLVALLQDAILLTWCWAVANIASSPERLRVLLATWAYSALAWVVALFIGLAAGVTVLTGQTPSEGTRTALTFGDPNYSASYYVISLMVIWASGYPRRRALRVVAYVLLVVALVSTGSNSGLVSLAIGSVVAVVLATGRRAGIAAAVVTLAAILLGGAAIASRISFKEVQTAAHGSRFAILRDGLGRSEKSVAQRHMLLSESLNLYRSGGPLGEGPVSTKPRLRERMAPFVKEAHDDYLAALIERGVLGVAGIGLLIGGLAVRLTRLVAAPLADGFADVVPRPHALVAAVVGTLVAMGVYELLHVRHMWALLAFVAALYLWGRR